MHSSAFLISTSMFPVHSVSLDSLIFMPSELDKKTIKNNTEDINLSIWEMLIVGDFYCGWCTIRFAAFSAADYGKMPH